MATFDTLAQDYERGRVGYSNDVYNALVGYGLKPRAKIVDVGCGTGLASGPLIENGFLVTGIDPSEAMLAVARREYPGATWQAGLAERLPFDDASVDATISGQAFHHIDRPKALAEMMRVLRKGGIVAVWWKHLVTGDSLKHLRESVASDLGMALPPSGLGGGFREFYALPWSETTLRVLPWRTTTTLHQYLSYERSRGLVHERLGQRVDDYIAALESRLRETFGPGDPTIPIEYSQYLYLAKK